MPCQDCNNLHNQHLCAIVASCSGKIMFASPDRRAESRRKADIPLLAAQERIETLTDEISRLRREVYILKGGNNEPDSK